MTLSKTLADFRRDCQSLCFQYSDDPYLARALSGLYYAFKSLAYVPPLVRELLQGDYREIADSGRADKACYFAESMIRSLHPCGDLSGQVVNICVLQSKHPRGDLRLETVLRDPGLDVKTKGHLQGISGSHEYAYIRDFANAAKHREFIERAVLHSDNQHRVQFQAFGERQPRDFDDVVRGGQQLLHAAASLVESLGQRDPSVPIVDQPRTWVSLTGSATVPDYGAIVTTDYEPGQS